MIFLVRWIASLLAAFVAFPVLFVMWNGPDRMLGYGGGIIMMAFVQFISPYRLWIAPLALGTVIAICWHVVARRKRAATLT